MVGTVYPNYIDSFAQLPTIVDNVSPVRAGDVNRLRDAVLAIENELGKNPSGTYGTVRDRLDAIETLTSVIAEFGGDDSNLVVDFISASLEQPINKDYFLVSAIPYDGYIFSTISDCSAGTATATVLINGTPLGGGPNSVSTSKQTVYHTSANGFLKGNEIKLTVSANAAVVDLNLTIVFIRAVSSLLFSSSGNDGYVQSISIPSTDQSIALYEGSSGSQIKQSQVRIDDLGNIVNATTLALGGGVATSTLHVNGSMSVAHRAVSANTTLLSTDCVMLGSAAGGSITLTLPAAVTANGRVCYFKKTDSSANLVSIARSGSNLIDGATTISLSIQYEAITLFCDGTNWHRF